MPLGQVLDIQNGFAFKSKHFSGTDGMPLVRIRDLKTGSGTVVNYFGDYDSQYIVEPGNLLIGMDGEFRCHEWQGKRGLLNQRVCKLVNFSEDLLPRFIYFGINKYLKEIEDRTSFTTVKHLSSKTIKSISFPVPPLEEQRRIVAVLDEAFEGLDRARAHVEGNLQNGQDLFVNWYANVFESVSSLNSVQTILVKDLALPEKGSIRTGPFGSQLLHSEFVEKGIVVLGIDNAVANEFRWGKRRFITSEKYDQIRRFTVHPGDVIITIMGTCGRCAIIPEDMPTAINTKHLCCISLDQEKCLPEYLHRYFLRSPVARSYLSAEASGSVMDGLNMGIIKNMPVTLPSIDKQRELIESFAEVETCTREVMARYEAQGNDLNDLRQSLLQRAFAGELT